jgi:HEAT repeat protein
LVACGVAAYEFKDQLGGDPSLDGRIRQLETGWSNKRREAATLLGQFPGDAERVVPALTKALDDSDLQVRQEAMRSLSVFGERAKAAAPTLRGLLEPGQDLKVRQQAAELLGQMKDNEALPALTGLLDDPGEALQIEAARALGRFGAAISTKPLVDKLMAILTGNHSVELRDASLDALDSIAAAEERICRAKAEILAKDPSPILRLKAVGAMKKPTFDFVIPSLVAALDDTDPQVRLCAAANLAWIGMNDDRPVPALCKAALKADEKTREGIGMVIDTLALDTSRSKSSEDQLAGRFATAVKELRTVLESRTAAAREQAINVLARVIATYQKSGNQALLEPAKSAVGAVLARMEDENEDGALRISAMNQWTVIQPIGPRSPAGGDAGQRKDGLHSRAAWIDALVKMLNSPSSGIRSRSAEILVDSFRDPGTDPSFRAAWRKVVPRLAATSGSPDPKVREFSLAILKMLGPEAVEAIEPLKALARDTKDSAVRLETEAVVRSVSVIEGLKAKDPSERAEAAVGLGSLGWRAAPALPALIETLHDPDARVRLAAATAFRALGTNASSALSALMAALPKEADAPTRAGLIQALDAIDPAARPVLEAHLSAFHDPDSKVRIAAVTMQRIAADDSAVAALRGALDDSSEEVRLAAATSLAGVMFENSAVIPTLLEAVEDSKKSAQVQEGLDNHFDNSTDQAEFARVRADLPKLRATLGTAVPALLKAAELKDDNLRVRLCWIMGRMVAFCRMSRDAELAKAIAPAVPTYLKGVDQSNPDVRQEVLGRLDSISTHRAEVVATLVRFLGRPDNPDGERLTAVSALAAQATFAEGDADVRKALEPSVPLLLKAVGDSKVPIRQAAIQALGNMGTAAKPAESALQDLAKNDPLPTIRDLAKNALQAVEGLAKMPARRSGGPGVRL